MVKIIILVLLALVVLSLGAAMFSLVRERGDSSRTAKFLSLRIGLSIALFVFLAIAFFMGWIQPHGIIPGAS